jgi:hypothetical protein
MPLRRAGYLGDVSALAALPPWRGAAADAPDAHGGLLAGTAGAATRAWRNAARGLDTLTRLALCAALWATGSGPDVHWFALPSGALRCTAQLFDGARVHGLHVAPAACCGGDDDDDDGGCVYVAAHGGRRVALFRLRRGGGGGSGAGAASVERVCALPGCAAWVLDVRALRGAATDAPPPRGAPPPLLAGAPRAPPPQPRRSRAAAVGPLTPPAPQSG